MTRLIARTLRNLRRFKNELMNDHRLKAVVSSRMKKG